MEKHLSLTTILAARGSGPAGVTAQRRFFVVGIAMFVVAAGLLLVRLLSAYLPDMGIGSDILFSVLVQIVILLLTTFLIYKFALKMRAREVLEFSNCRKTKWYNYALAVPLGILVLFVTLGVSTFWLMILMSFGYMPTSNPGLPAVFDPGRFVLDIVLTALLPAVCEEFAIRGGLFTVMKKSYKGIALYVVMGAAFGLFHQDIRQVFYTALFGGAMAFLMVKTKSVWPCVIVHFMNNFSSVYMDNARAYGWFGGGAMDYIFSGTASFGILMLVFAAVAAAFIGMLFVFHYLNGNRTLNAKKETILDSGFNHTQNRVVLVGEENPDKVRELDTEKEVYGGKLPDALYKPKLKDAAFFIGAIAIAAAYTLFTFVYGFFY